MSKRKQRFYVADCVCRLGNYICDGMYLGKEGEHYEVERHADNERDFLRWLRRERPAFEVRRLTVYFDR